MKKMIRENPEGFMRWTKSRRGRNYLRIFRAEDSEVTVAIFAHATSFRLAGTNIKTTLFAKNGDREMGKNFDPPLGKFTQPEEIFRAIPKDFASDETMGKIEEFISNTINGIY